MQQTELLYDEIVDMVKNSDDPVYFHYSKDGLYVKSIVEMYEDYQNGFKVQFQQGYVQLWNSHKIDKINRPDNLIIKCNSCYRLYNENDEVIGCLYN